jgi:hypothetical protein
MRSRRRVEPDDDREAVAHGTSYWQTTEGGQPLELNSRDHLTIGPTEASWEIAPMIPGMKPGQPVVSSSPVVVRFLRRMRSEKVRVARQSAVRRAAPKPVPKARYPKP